MTVARLLIDIPQWGHVTLIEAIWLASGLLALLVSTMRMRPLVFDYRDATEIDEADLRLLARSYLRREVVRIAQAGCVIVIGGYAAISAPLVPGPAQVTVVGLVITIMLLTITLLISLQSVLDWRDRNHVRKILTGKMR